MSGERDGDFERVTLPSGARSVRHVGHGEVMHPAVGPWAEATRLYVEQPRLAARLCDAGAGPLLLWDVGLGAATNAAAAITCARSLGVARRAALHVVSFERDLAPLRLALADAEGFAHLGPLRDAAHALLRGDRHDEPGITWTLARGEFAETISGAPGPVELVFYDPFSPRADPAPWTPAALAAVRARCRDDARLYTYSAATPTRVSLLLAGFFVGAGASVGSKRETTAAATRLDELDQPLDARWIARWQRSTARAPHGGTPEGDALTAALRAHPQLSGLF